MFVIYFDAIFCLDFGRESVLCLPASVWSATTLDPERGLTPRSRRAQFQLLTSEVRENGKTIVEIREKEGQIEREQKGARCEKPMS